jgi:hypothetical protein
MTTQSEIDDVLRQLGGVDPPAGLEQRVSLRLQNQRRRFSITRTHALSAVALAASVTLSAVALSPSLRTLVFHQHSSAPSVRAVEVPRTIAPVSGGFGTASAVHVPVEPVPVQPTPLNQGRGRSRSGRAVLPPGAWAPLPRGVAHPLQGASQVPSTNPSMQQPSSSGADSQR